MEIINPPLGKKPASKKKIAVRNKSTNLIKNTLSMEILCTLFLEKKRRPKSYHPLLSLDNS